MHRVPRATYRLQFNAGFTFDDARRIAPYLAELGISDIYASPILRARKGSAHGYDVVDATALNPELGSEDDFTALHDELQRLGMGLLLDIVPNHMAASDENAWWMSVLENGPHSRFLHYFDIDWSPVTAHGQTVNKVLLPILGRPYGEALESQEIKLAFDADGFFFTYYDKRLPLAPSSYRLILRDCVDSLPQEGVAIELRELVQTDGSVPNSKFLKETIRRIYESDEEFRASLDGAIERINGEAGKPESFNALDALLDSQWYRLAYWRIASQKIKKSAKESATLRLVENPDILAEVAKKTTMRPAVVIGFAAETENVIANAMAKLRRKGCDLIIANSVAEGTTTFGGEINQVQVIDARGVESWPPMTKAEVANGIVRRLAVELAKH